MAVASARGPGLVAVAAAFLLPVAFASQVGAPAWTPKVVVALLAGAVGVVVLVADVARERRGATLAAVAFLAVATAATLLSGDMRASIAGLYGWGTGLVFWFVAFGAWALGRHLAADERERVELALVAGCLVSAVVAVLQLTTPIGTEALAPVFGRATGLAGNPVHLGALSSAALALAVPRAGRGLRWPAATMLLATAVQISGTRVALVMAVVVAAVSARPLGRRGRAVAASAVFAGLGAGLLVGSLTSHESGSGRLAQGPAEVSGSFEARTETWWSARHAVASRPLIGAGPGRFRAATSSHRTLKLARAEGPEKLFVDGHNLAVELIVTTGVLGVLTFAAWLVLACGATAGRLGVVALSLLVAHLVEPLSVSVTVPAFLALGAARAGPEPAPRARIVGLASVIAAAVALVFGASVLVGDIALERASVDFTAAQAESAVDRLSWWPEPHLVAGRVRAFRSDPGALPAALTRYRQAVARDDSDPRLRDLTGMLALRIGRTEEAERQFLVELRLNPWSRNAARGLARIALARGRPDEAERWARRVLLFGDDRSARELIRQAGDAQRGSSP